MCANKNLQIERKKGSLCVVVCKSMEICQKQF